MRLVLLDRDGVINRRRDDHVKTPEEVKLLPHVPRAIGMLNRMHVKVAVVTNQPAIGRGLMTEEDLRQVHEAIAVEINKVGARIDKFVFCPDHPDRPTQRRKPGPGMLLEAMRHYHAFPEDTVMVGDSMVDMLAAQTAGCGRILVLTGNGKKTEAQGLEAVTPVEVCKNILTAAELIVSRMR